MLPHELYAFAVETCSSYVTVLFSQCVLLMSVEKYLPAEIRHLQHPFLWFSVFQSWNQQSQFSPESALSTGPLAPVLPMPSVCSSDPNLRPSSCTDWTGIYIRVVVSLPAKLKLSSVRKSLHFQVSCAKILVDQFTKKISSKANSSSIAHSQVVKGKGTENKKCFAALFMGSSFLVLICLGKANH